jgi:small-conductance mechanosensitive channel
MESYGAFWARLWAWLPGVGGALVILIIGVLVAKLLGSLAARFLEKVGVDKAAEKIGIDDSEGELSIQTPLSRIGGKLVFWAIMLIAIMSASSLLGLNRISGVLDTVVNFMPRVFSAVAILLAGVLLAIFVRRAVRGAAEHLGANYARAAGILSYWFIVIVAVLVAVTQLEIETRLIGRLLLVVVASIGLLLALALGLGLRGLSSHIVSGVYARDIFTEGMRVQIEGQPATVERVGTTTTRLRKDDGSLRFVPNRYLIDQIIDQDGPRDDGNQAG